MSSLEVELRSASASIINSLQFGCIGESVLQLKSLDKNRIFHVEGATYRSEKFFIFLLG